MTTVASPFRSSPCRSIRGSRRRQPRLELATRVAWTALGLLGTAWPAAVAAQDEAAGGGTSGGLPEGAVLMPAAPPTTTTTTTYRNSFMPEPGTNLDAHLPSSAQSKTDIDQGDGFDLKPPAGDAPTLRGNPDSLGVLRDNPSEPTVRSSGVGSRAFHIVRRGDTLWKICAEQFDDPRLWPRVWSYNPQLQNPHWIYPGDQLRLRPEAGSPVASESGALGAPIGRVQGGTLGEGIVGRAPSVPPETVFLRDLGYIDDPNKDVWGQVVGARKEQQLLSEGNEVYLILRPGVQVELGQQLTVFRDVREPASPEGARRPPGQIIAFQGTVKINAWDPEKRVARGLLTESLDVIERGAKVGPLGRRFYVVPPASSQVSLSARILTSMYPHVIMGRDQVVFIDRGQNDGLKPGNRLFVIRQGDAWRRTLPATTAMARDRIRLDLPNRVEIESTPLAGDQEMFPEEVVAELRVIRAHRYSSLALVTRSSEEIEPGDLAVAREGY